jgi:serine/threonine-protein kinase RsbW
VQCRKQDNTAEGGCATGFELLDTMPASDHQWTWQCDQVIPNNIAVGRRLLDDVLQQLELLHWGQCDIFGVHLAVDEALVNAMLHGNAADESKHVQFSCRISPRKIRVEIIDEGPGFNPDCVPDPTSPARLGCPGGRGVLLMRTFMGHVEFLGCGNHVVLQKERGA